VPPKFNIQEFYMVITLPLRIVYGPQKKNPNFSFNNYTSVFITEVENVYCAVRTESLYNTVTTRL